jgi:hypothetical protein
MVVLVTGTLVESVGGAPKTITQVSAKGRVGGATKKSRHALNPFVIIAGHVE